MRIDHHAFQRATGVAGFGLLLQIAIGVTLLVFGLVSNDTAFQFASAYVLAGVLVWVGLIIIFHQHKLERLEALEEDELASTRAGAASVFERMGQEARVAARRLHMMHKWMMPILSIVLALALAGCAAWLLGYLKSADFQRTPERGWAVAICLSAAAVSFIFSRFVAGMAKQPAWANLRGGAAYMVGNALVLVAVAAGTTVQLVKGETPSRFIEYVAWAIPIFMIGVALEIVLNFVLNLYRPRIPGEVPRPAFDSKVLSLLATPDSIVRSLNEAVNYQFGFDVTSSWGYQLLLRSFVWLVVLALLAMLALSTMVIVEPHQQAVRLRGGRLVGDVHKSGVMWKWPWPFETAAVYDVSPVRSLHLTAKVIQPVDEFGRPRPIDVNLWDQPDPPKTDAAIDSFIVGSSLLGEEPIEQPPPPTPETRGAANEVASQVDEERAAQIVSGFHSLVDCEIVLHYRIRDGGLLDYLRFAPEAVSRAQKLTDRERALKALALEQVSLQLSKLTLDEVLSPGRADLSRKLAANVQRAFDSPNHPTGVEVVAVTIPMMRPAGRSAPAFEELGISVQASLKRLADADRSVDTTFGYWLGDSKLKDQVLAEIDKYNQLLARLPDGDETIRQRQKVESLLIAGGGVAAQTIAAAERDRWRTINAKRSQASRVQSQLAAYHAAPRLYKQRETMQLYKQHLTRLNKYIIAIDPERVNVSVDLKTQNPILEWSGVSETEAQRKNE
jgi:membrane protease subunit HflK